MQVALTGSVLDRVTVAIKQTTYQDNLMITLDTQLDSDLSLGGFDRLKLVMHLEQSFDIELSDEVLQRFTTVGDIVKYISSHYFPDVDPFWLTEAA